MAAEKQHNWLKSGFYNLAQNIQSLVFGFGSFYLLIRLIDKQSFGIWILFVATTTIFDMARSGLIQNGLIKSLSSAPPEQHRDIISASIYLSGILMAVCIVINIAMAGFLADLWHYPGLKPMFYAYSLVYLAQGVLAQFQWVEQATMSFSGVLVSGIIKQGLPFLFILGCFMAHGGFSLLYLIYAQFVSTVLGAAVEYLFVRRHFSVSFKVYKVYAAHARDLFNYGKYAFGTTISIVLIGTINQIMLGTMLSPAAAGSYGVIGKITNLTDIPTTALGTVLFPQSARRFASQGNDSTKHLYERSVGAILALLVPILLVLALFPAWVIHIIAGSKYPETIPMLRLTAFTCLLSPFNRLFGVILDSTGKPKVNFIITLLFASLESILIYFLVRQYNIMGAIYANFAAAAIFFIVMQAILRKGFKVNFLHPFIDAVKFYPGFMNSYVKPYFEKNKRELPA